MLKQIELKGNYYVIADPKTGAVAHFTMGTNRTESWNRATRYGKGTPKSQWLADGWKCIPVRLETR